MANSRDASVSSRENVRVVIYTGVDLEDVYWFLLAQKLVASGRKEIPLPPSIIYTIIYRRASFADRRTSPAEAGLPIKEFLKDAVDPTAEVATASPACGT